ncbi:MAG: hypothetical protein KF841_09730 [Phycisphaerae bacterium]|nr:hypothetical protein [Phycisphaerae bacterium]
MFASGYQVTDVLMLVLCVGPVATYFLTLGLVNSHARPCIITSRADFISLTIVLIPLLVVPLPTLAGSSHLWLLGLATLGFAMAFHRLLPAADAGFVIYNISEKRCRRLVEDALRSIGWHGSWSAETWHDRDGRFALSLRSFTPLRNVTLHVEHTDGIDPAVRLAALRAAMEHEFRSVSQMPSTMGACLVMVGVALMIIPLWMVSRHIDQLVDAVTYLFG